MADLITNNGTVLYTDIGGRAKKYTNRTGGASVKGTQLAQDPSNDNSVILATETADVIGIMYSDGIANLGEVWVIEPGGVAEIKPAVAETSTRGDDVLISGTAGYAQTASGSSETMGKALESKGAGVLFKAAFTGGINAGGSASPVESATSWMTGNVLSNSSSETDLLTIVIPANSTSNRDIMEFYHLFEIFNLTGAAKTVTFKLYIGATSVTFASSHSIADNRDNKSVARLYVERRGNDCIASFMPNGEQSSPDREGQYGSGFWVQGDRNYYYNDFAGTANGLRQSVTWTSNVTVKISAQFNAADALLFAACTELRGLHIKA